MCNYPTFLSTACLGGIDSQLNAPVRGIVTRSRYGLRRGGGGGEGDARIGSRPRCVACFHSYYYFVV